MNRPYRIHIANRGNLEVVVHGLQIGVIDRKYMMFLQYRHGFFLLREFGDHVIDRNIYRIATKDDIQRTGIWELVVNQNAS